VLEESIVQEVWSQKFPYESNAALKIAKMSFAVNFTDVDMQAIIKSMSSSQQLANS